MARIKKGDQVIVIAGKDKGKTGRVLEVLKGTDRVIVEGVQRVTKHTKVGQSQQGARTGGIETVEAPIHASNVMLVDPKTKKRTRVGFRVGNVMEVGRVVKVVVNMGVGEAAHDSKMIEGAVRDLAAITGQKPQVTRARKSIAQFKLREGMPIGAHSTLRGDRMWEFLDRLVSISLPRIRDFRGLSPKQFDGNGNYTFGLTEQAVFHEIDQDQIDRVRGMDITVVTTAKTDEEARSLLKQLGFPFKEK